MRCANIIVKLRVIWWRYTVGFCYVQTLNIRQLNLLEPEFYI